MARYMEDRKATIKGVFRHDSNEQLLARYAWYVTHITSEECSTDDDFQLIKAEILQRMKTPMVMKFVDQLEDGIDESLVKYSAGMVLYREDEDIFQVAYEQSGAQKTFSIGQPIFDYSGNRLGYLGVGLYRNLNYSGEEQVPCERWIICNPTAYCISNQPIKTYWQIVAGI